MSAENLNKFQKTKEFIDFFWELKNDEKTRKRLAMLAALKEKSGTCSIQEKRIMQKLRLLF